MGASKQLHGDLAQNSLDTHLDNHYRNTEIYYNQLKSKKMKKNAKVTGVQANGTWEGKYGVNYKFEISFDNGDAGEYSSNKFTSVQEIPFTVGEQTDYEYTDGQYPKVKVFYDKPFTPNVTKSSSVRGNDNDRELLIVRQSSLKIASEFLNVNGFKNTDRKGAIDELIDVADILTNWVMSTGSTQIKLGGSVENGTNQKIENVLASDDLPF